MFDATCSHLDAIIVSSRRLHTLLFNLSRTPSSYRREPRPDSLHDLLSSVCCLRQSSSNLQMVGLQNDLLKDELASHSIKFAVGFDFLTHTFQGAFTLQYSVVVLEELREKCVAVRGHRSLNALEHSGVHAIGIVIRFE